MGFEFQMETKLKLIIKDSRINKSLLGQQIHLINLNK
jgi:hypothetical protein